MKPKGSDLYRNTAQGKIAGICAGIADYFGWETWLVRILVVSGVLFGIPFLVLGYIAAWFILDEKPETPVTTVKSRFHKADNDSKKYNNRQSEHNNEHESIKVKTRIWQSGEPPKQAFHDIRKQFKTLEKKLQRIEHYVTSTEFTVAREINKL